MSISRDTRSVADASQKTERQEACAEKLQLVLLHIVRCVVVLITRCADTHDTLYNPVLQTDLANADDTQLISYLLGFRPD